MYSQVVYINVQKGLHHNVLRQNIIFESDRMKVRFLWEVLNLDIIKKISINQFKKNNHNFEKVFKKEKCWRTLTVIVLDLIRPKICNGAHSSLGISISSTESCACDFKENKK